MSRISPEFNNFAQNKLGISRFRVEVASCGLFCALKVSLEFDYDEAIKTGRFCVCFMKTLRAASVWLRIQSERGTIDAVACHLAFRVFAAFPGVIKSLRVLNSDAVTGKHRS